jgi:tripartite-type tricarboxylate transporter receptor subunit TctC
MKLPRRQFLHLAAGAVALPVITRIAWAQTYPTRPITLIVPFAAGGPTDVIARIVAEHMSHTLGKPLVIENVSGAGGTTGSIRAMRANPDGYTIQIGNVGTHTAAVALYPNLAYRPDVDFEPIGIVPGIAMLIVGRKDLPPKDLKEFISYAKANSEKLNMAHAGVGGASHFTCLLLNSLLGVKPTMVPFNSGTLAMNAVVGGQVDYMCAATADVVSQVQGGTIKAYAIGTAERSLALPNIPTSTEAGLPQFQALIWDAFFAPRGTPKPILDKLTDVLGKALEALIERLPPPPDEREMNELIRRTWELLHDRKVTTQSPPGYRKSDTGGRGKRTTEALGKVIRHCFGNYARWRKSPE